MTVRNLEYLFRPRSVAVLGASARPGSVGAVLTRNVLEGGFKGPVWPVNPRHDAVAGTRCYRELAALPEAPELAVICTPAASVPGLIAELGARGTKAAIVITAGLDAAARRAMLEASRPHTLRVLGPNCLGLLAPGIGLNASFAHRPALSGKIAFVSQSGALCTVVLDWAAARGIGFSAFVSLGEAADADFGDLIDYLGADPDTRAILLYIEAVTAARKFMSAARAAARNKPVLAIKAGRAPEGARAAASHTGAMAGADAVYDAALRRAGILRVFETEELFAAVETLARARPLAGDRLAIVSNGGGPGVLAADAAVLGGARLATLSPATVKALDEALPAIWSRANPVDLIGDAPGGRYRRAMEVVLADPEVDAVLAMHAPVAVADAVDAAEAVIAAAKTSPRCVLTAWLGADWVVPARKRLAEAGLPGYDTPDQAVRAFLHLVHYRRNQEQLIETPPALPAEFRPDAATARAAIATARVEGRDLLTEIEAKAVLAAYGLPVVTTREAADVESARTIAAEIGYPVALKILSPDISHKSDVGGVALDLAAPEALQSTAHAMLERVRRLRPEARLRGFSVQAMAKRPGAHELILGLACDPVFGPAVLFGQGGIAVEAIGDRAVGLPPLNLALARALIERTRIFRLLRGYRDRPPVDLAALALALVWVAQIAVDLPEIAELDINPLWADPEGVLALDARVKLLPEGRRAVPAIRPYPTGFERKTRLGEREVLIRPIRPEDEPGHFAFFSRLAPEEIRFRFFGLVRSFDHGQMARFTQIDYDREMAFVAIDPDSGETLGVARAVADPDNVDAEFAVVVRSDLKGHGLGRALMETLIGYCRGRGTRTLSGQVLGENRRMLDLAAELGFSRRILSGGEAVAVRLDLQKPLG
ncbi:MAG: bifunctional acetate--CoA ligase family protein/GNAT family N-acetyltransferase [Alphaproteobacteria bacterium]|nr:bifunctional acetate--CoA ligase family protein/GNAT family N-acetyltransferase [Alphaproteobacteria bacterium]